MSERFPELFDLIGWCYDQDWGDDGKSAEEELEATIADFPTSQKQDVVRGVFAPMIAEIDDWFTGNPSDEDTGELLTKEFYSYYVPAEDGISNNKWLMDLRERLVREIENADPDG